MINVSGVRLPRIRVTHAAKLLVAAGAALAVLAAGLPASAELDTPTPTAGDDPLGLTDIGGMTPEEILGMERYDGPDERRTAEETGERHSDRPEVEGVDPVPVRVVDPALKAAEPVEIPTPARSSRWEAEIAWPEPGRDEGGVVELSAGDVEIELLDRGAVSDRGARSASN